MHDAPWAHEVQPPSLQTMSVPHIEPFCWTPLLSAHVVVPVVHEVVPVWQALLGMQASPEVHPVHVPALQTMLVPHVVPSMAFDPVSTQEGPPEHDVLPV